MNVLDTAKPLPLPSAPMNWFQRHKLMGLLILVFGFTWSILVPVAADSHNLLPVHVPIVLSVLIGWGPALAAILLAGIAGGKAGIKQLLRRLLLWKVGFQWYLFALLGPAAYILVGIGIGVLLGNPSPSIPMFGAAPLNVIISFVILLVAGMLLNTEEIAWRGLALPLLETRYSALVASLILGLIHTLWHLPYFFTANRPFYEQLGFGWFAAWTIALTIIFTWIYNNTGGSLLLPMLFHNAQFAWQQLLSPSDVRYFIPSILVLWGIAIVLVIVYGRAYLSRKQTSPAI